MHDLCVFSICICACVGVCVCVYVSFHASFL